MKKISLLFSFLVFSTTTLANEHGKGVGAHEHGSIKLEVAVEGKIIELDIDGPAESFVGFEYSPKTAKEKKTWADAESLWNKDLLTKLFILDKKLGCTSSEVSFKQEVDEEGHKASKKEAGVHSDVEAKAKITCAQDLKGQSLTVGLKKHFPHIKKLTIDLVGSETKTIDVKRSLETIKL